MERRCLFKGRRLGRGRNHSLIIITAALLLVTFLAAGLSAEEYRIVPKKDPDIPNGRVMALQGTVGPQGQKFIIEDLSILQPVEITLLSKEDETDLVLELCKFDWKKPERSGSTKGTGARTFRIRTQGDLKIFVASTGGEKTYQLAVWVGDEVQPNIQPAFIPKGEFKKTKGGSSSFGTTPGSPILWVIALLLAAILVALIILLKRGKKA